MAAVTICSDFGAPQNKALSVSIVSPSICHAVMGLDAQQQEAERERQAVGRGVYGGRRGGIRAPTWLVSNFLVRPASS